MRVMHPRASQTGSWGRRRLAAMLAGLTVAGVGTLGGLGYAAYATLTHAGRSSTTPASPVVDAGAATGSGQARRDAIAAAPMLQVSLDESRGGTPAPTPAPRITIPAATTLGPADVPTGYPHTPAGAIGQLAAIEQTVVQTMTIGHATTVHQQWSAPGAPPAEEWELTGAVQGFLASAAAQYAGDPTLLVEAVPAAAQVKGADGPDWVLACVLLDVKVTVVVRARGAYGHCEAMAWDTGRWVIAAGPAPARAPSTWPGTDLATDAGWRTWVTDTQEVSR